MADRSADALSLPLSPNGRVKIKILTDAKSLTGTTKQGNNIGHTKKQHRRQPLSGRGHPIQQGISERPSDNCSSPYPRYGTGRSHQPLKGDQFREREQRNNTPRVAQLRLSTRNATTRSPRHKYDTRHIHNDARPAPASSFSRPMFLYHCWGIRSFPWWCRR